jgi:gamma-glutamyltranspeptidase/glutathione hydrolase
LAAKFPINLTEQVVFPNNFACPSAVMQDVKTGEHTGISDVMSPWSGAVAQA